MTAVWDDRKDHNLGVMATIDYGWLGSYIADFIVAPRKFVAESSSRLEESLNFQTGVDEVRERLLANYGDVLKVKQAAHGVAANSRRDRLGHRAAVHLLLAKR